MKSKMFGEVGVEELRALKVGLGEWDMLGGSRCLGLLRLV